jgi:hypothetical protein
MWAWRASPGKRMVEVVRMAWVGGGFLEELCV